jgi:hypothetical protein
LDHNKRLEKTEFHNLYYPPNIISIIKRKMRWVRHIACMRLLRNITLSGRDERITFLK